MNGNIFITANPNDIYDAMYSGIQYRVVKMSEDINLNLNNIITVGGTILLPPYNIISAELDGEDTRKLYSDHLMSKDCESYICTIIKAIKRGVNIIILIDQDMLQFTFINTLIYYIYYISGIMIYVGPSLCSFDNTKTGLLLSKLYFHSLIDYNEYMTEYPKDINLPEWNILKLINDINPDVPYEQRNEIGYYNYFNAMKNNYGYNNKNNMIIPGIIG